MPPDLRSISIHSNSATKLLPRRCLRCAWSGEIHRAVKHCPDCGEPFDPLPGPYRVEYCPDMQRIISTPSNVDKLIKVIEMADNAGFLVYLLK